jgi:hypothetical protein
MAASSSGLPLLQKRTAGRMKGHTAAFSRYKKARLAEFQAQNLPSPPNEVLLQQYLAAGLGDNASDTTSMMSDAMTTEDELDGFDAGSVRGSVCSSVGVGDGGAGFGGGGAGFGDAGFDGGVPLDDDWEFSMDGMTATEAMPPPAVQDILRAAARPDTTRVRLGRADSFPAPTMITDHYTVSYAVSVHNASNRCKPTFMERYMYKHVFRLGAVVEV